MGEEGDRLVCCYEPRAIKGTMPTKLRYYLIIKGYFRLFQYQLLRNLLFKK